MDSTVFLTIFAGVVTYVLGQIVLKLVIEPVQDLRRTIGAISLTLIERANVTQNPGMRTPEIMEEASRELRKLASQLQSHLYLIPSYRLSAQVFRLPSRERIALAAGALIGLSNGVSQRTGSAEKANAQRVETISDALGIYLADGDRWPKEPT